MRFDEASAVYGVFGRFITGIAGSLDERCSSCRGPFERHARSTRPPAHVHPALHWSDRASQLRPVVDRPRAPKLAMLR
ncbi:MAG: hypothetical protein R2749_04290 [Acidimicrobiales bacterium]